jgi:hypothetical protein
MSRCLYAEISCTEADKARLKAAADLIEALGEGDRPADLPPELIGQFKSVDEFEEVLIDQGDLHYVDYYEEPGRITIDDGELDLNGIADLVQACFVDSLPAVIYWTDDHSGGVYVVFEKVVRCSSTWQVAEQLLKEGPLQAAAA